MTLSGCMAATSVTKSHSPSRRQTSRPVAAALADDLGLDAAETVGVNQALATLRNVRWSGGSMLIIVRICEAADLPGRATAPRAARRHARSVQEALGLPRDLADVGVPGDRPERHPARRLEPRDGRLRAQLLPLRPRVAALHVAARLDQVRTVDVHLLLLRACAGCTRRSAQPGHCGAHGAERAGVRQDAASGMGTARALLANCSRPVSAYRGP